MPFSSWFSFLLVSLAASFSPGPGVMLALSTSASFGPRRTMLSSAGNALGVATVALLAVSGVGLLMQHSPMAFWALKAAGAVYLMVLGIKQWRASVGDPGPRAHAVGGRSIFLRGLIVALSNPKGILFFTAVFPQFMAPASTPTMQLVLMTLLFVACTLLSHASYVTVARLFGGIGPLAKHRRSIQRLGAVIFLAMGCAMLTLTMRAPA